MFDFDGDGDFDAFDEFIEYSIIFDEDVEATCPACYSPLEVAAAGNTSCPSCGASIRVE